MTREDFYKKIEKVFNEEEISVTVDFFKEIFDEVFDYFENRVCEIIMIQKATIKTRVELELNKRTCKNCKWYDNELLCCDNEENLHMLGFTLTEICEEFGCNKFEPKEK